MQIEICECGDISVKTDVNGLEVSVRDSGMYNVQKQV